MQMCYRGVRYEYDPHPIEYQEGEVIGRYRGRPVRSHEIRRGYAWIEHLHALLTYRGVSYES